LILDLEFHQYLGSLKHVINIIMGFRDMGCYIGRSCRRSSMELADVAEMSSVALNSGCL
jgi:hypothetical protein